MIPQINAMHAQLEKRGEHDEVGAKDHAEAATNQEQAAAAPEADPKAVETGVKRVESRGSPVCPHCEATRQNIGVIAYFPLASGLLTGAAAEQRRK